MITHGARSGSWPGPVPVTSYIIYARGRTSTLSALFFLTEIIRNSTLRRAGRKESVSWVAP